MTVMTDTALAALDAGERLFNPVFRGALPSTDLAGFRGELALRFAPKLADEARPPEIMAEQVMIVADTGSTKIRFLCAYLLSFEYLKSLVDVLDDALTPDGKYFVFCNNIDLATRYAVTMSGATFQVLPIDDATAYNELLELLYLEKTELKRLDTGGKLEKIFRKALQWQETLPAMSYEEGLERMGPVRDPNENRPV